MTFFISPRRAKITLFMFLSIIGLGACGNKGPLYIPPPPVEQQTAPAEEQVSDKQVSEEG